MIKRVWYAMPEQVRHLLVPAVVIIAGYLLARYLLVPSDFGLWGHYRASSVVQNASQNIKYAGSEACAECHEDLVAKKKTGYHVGVSCETCHGPAASHTREPEKTKPAVAKGRANCLICHEYVPSRPSGFPQVVSDSHNPLQACTKCHQPHDPKPPQAPKGCDACHTKIHRTMALSRHATLKCTSCHEVPKQHNVQPRGNRPKKIQHRETCGTCHSQDAPGNGIPRVNMVTHGEKYLCWQCHAQHMPEVR